MESGIALAEHFQDVPVLIIGCTEGRPEGRNPERLAGLYGNILPVAWSLHPLNRGVPSSSSSGPHSH